LGTFGRSEEHALRDSKAKERLVFHGQPEKTAKIEMAWREASWRNFAVPTNFSHIVRRMTFSLFDGA
jgi:hypothetical protein